MGSAKFDRGAEHTFSRRQAAPESHAAFLCPVFFCGRVARSQWAVIVDTDSDTELPDGRVGEIWLHGDNLGRGYWRRPEETALTFENKLQTRLDSGSHAEGAPVGAAWLRTGDLGMYLHDELYIVGRIKDLVIVDGRNHYPQDIEATVTEASDHVRPAVVAAFSVEGDDVEKLVIIAERDFRKDESGDAAAIAAIRAAVTSSHGIQPEDVRIVDIDELPRSSAGKIARRVARAAYLDGGFE